jgi:hypothetical protein
MQTYHGDTDMGDRWILTTKGKDWLYQAGLL